MTKGCRYIVLSEARVPEIKIFVVGFSLLLTQIWLINLKKVLGEKTNICIKKISHSKAHLHLPDLHAIHF